MRKLLLSLFLIFSIFSFAQVVVTQEKFPTENQKKLIDEFMEISNYRTAILNVANIRVFVKSMELKEKKSENSIDDADRKRILNYISKRYSDKNILYFDFMNLTEDNLNSLINFYKENRNLLIKSDYIFASGVIFHNLDNEIDHQIKNILKEKSLKN